MAVCSARPMAVKRLRASASSSSLLPMAAQIGAERTGTSVLRCMGSSVAWSSGEAIRATRCYKVLLTSVY